MPEFTGVDLEDSWVLGWSSDPAAGRLTLDLEASIWPGHPAHSPPLADEYACYRQATLSFEGVAELSGLREQSEVPGRLDPNGRRDFDGIDALEYADGVFQLPGEMGDVTIRAAALRLRVATEISPVR